MLKIIAVEKEDYYLKIVEDLNKDFKSDLEVQISYDMTYKILDGNKKNFYVIMDVLGKNAGTMKTIDYVKSFEVKVDKCFNFFEERLIEIEAECTCSTKDYWLNEYGIIFD